MWINAINEYYVFNISKDYDWEGNIKKIWKYYKNTISNDKMIIYEKNKKWSLWFPNVHLIIDDIYNHNNMITNN